MIGGNYVSALSGSGSILIGYHCCCEGNFLIGKHFLSSSLRVFICTYLSYLHQLNGLIMMRFERSCPHDLELGI